MRHLWVICHVQYWSNPNLVFFSQNSIFFPFIFSPATFYCYYFLTFQYHFELIFKNFRSFSDFLGNSITKDGGSKMADLIDTYLICCGNLTVVSFLQSLGATTAKCRHRTGILKITLTQFHSAKVLSADFENPKTS